MTCPQLLYQLLDSLLHDVALKGAPGPNQSEASPDEDQLDVLPLIWLWRGPPLWKCSLHLGHGGCCELLLSAAVFAGQVTILT